MTKVKLKYLDKRCKKSGTTKWFFRHPTVPRTRLPGQPGESAFQAAYAPLLALVEATEAANLERDNPHSTRSLVESYLGSDEWLQLAAKTRKDYRRELDRLCEMVGDLPYASLTREGVRALRKQVKAMTVASRQAAIATRARKDFLDNEAWIEKAARHEAAGKLPPTRPKSKRKPPPPVTNTTGARTADYFTTVLSALMEWAIEDGRINSNPVAAIKKLHRGKNVIGRKPWTDYQIQYAIDHAPRHISDGVVLGAYTGQRLADCCAMGKAHCVGPDVRIIQQKTGALVNVRAVGPLAMLIERRRSENELRRDELLLSDDGSPYSERLFSEHLRIWLDEQGWGDLSFHGLRYAAAGALNEAGATVATIVAVLGHHTYQMAMKYLMGREEQERAAGLMSDVAFRRGNGRV